MTKSCRRFDVFSGDLMPPSFVELWMCTEIKVTQNSRLILFTLWFDRKLLIFDRRYIDVQAFWQVFSVKSPTELKKTLRNFHCCLHFKEISQYFASKIARMKYYATESPQLKLLDSLDWATNGYRSVTKIKFISPPIASLK